MMACWKGIVVLMPVIMYSPNALDMRLMQAVRFEAVAMTLAIMES